MKRKAEQPKETDLRMSCDAVRQIRQHARASSKAEVCGVLIGTEDVSVTFVQASIPGSNAVQGGSHVTFTQDTWEHIYRIKDRDYPDARIVGWYHSHPGFGVFYSEHDRFIQRHFFSGEGQLGIVIDPQRPALAAFECRDGEVEQLPGLLLTADRATSGAAHLLLKTINYDR